MATCSTTHSQMFAAPDAAVGPRSSTASNTRPLPPRTTFGTVRVDARGYAEAGCGVRTEGGEGDERGHQVRAARPRRRRAVRARLPGPDRHLPRHRASSTSRSARSAIAGVFMQWELHRRSTAGRSCCRRSSASLVVGVPRRARPTGWSCDRCAAPAPLVRVIATLGVLITIQAAVVLRYGSNSRQVASWLPTDRVTSVGRRRHHRRPTDPARHRRASRPSACGCSTATRQFGLATEAVSESERSASAIGLSPEPDRRCSTGRSAAAIAAVAGDPRSCRSSPCRPTVHDRPHPGRDGRRAGRRLPLVPDRARSPGSRSASARREVDRYVEQDGRRRLAAVHRDHGLLVVRGQVAAAARLLAAAAADDRQRPHQRGPGSLFGCGAVVFMHGRPRDRSWIDAITVTLGVAIVLLSIVVLTGYAGQLSLAQFAIAGFGAYVAGRLVAVFRHAVPGRAPRRGRRRRPARGRCSGCRRCERAGSTWRSSRSGWARRSS